MNADLPSPDDDLTEDLPSDPSDGFLTETYATKPASVPGTGAMTIAHYQIQRVLASGGMGTVYQATQERPRRTVALKVMKYGVTSPKALRRFEFESQLLARLRHPGIAQVYEAGTHDDGSAVVPYFAMEFIPDAKPLTQYADERALSTADRLALFKQVCEAVHHGHQKGVIHRDLKPGNILVDSDGQVKIIDFGVARSTDSDMTITTMQTAVGQLIGTLQYMSPEQCEADPHNIDTRSDVYALGVLLYELLSGRLPYDLRNTAIFEATRVIREQTPARLSMIDKTMRGDVETIVAKALEKDRERRYQSALAIAEDINRYLNHEPIIARPPSAPYRLRKFVRKRRLPLAVAVLLTIAVGIAVYQQIQAGRAALAASFETASRLYFEAQLESHRNPEKALQKYDEALAVVPEYLQAKIDRAFLLYRLNRIEPAIVAAEEIIRDFPEQAGPAHLLIGQIYVGRDATRDQQAGASHLEKGARLLPDDTYYRALALGQDQNEEAVQLLTTVIESDVLNFDALWARAWRYHDLSDWAAMLADTERLVARWPETSNYWNAKGVALARLGRYEEAIGSYDETLRLTPRGARAHLNRAETYLKLAQVEGRSPAQRSRDLAQAIADCTTSIELLPDQAVAYALRAKIHTVEGALVRAREDLNRAFELDPDYSQQLQQLRYEGENELEYGAFQSALRFYNRGMPADEGTAQDFHNRGRLRRIVGKYEHALADHDRAVSLAPQVPLVYMGRGTARRFVGDVDGALADFAKTAALDPSTWALNCNLWNWEMRMLRGDPGDREAAAAALNAAQNAVSSPIEGKVVDLCRGQITPAEVLPDVADNPILRCCVLYYAGAAALVDGRPADARSWFQQCRDTGAHRLPEYDLASWHLVQLDAAPARSATPPAG